MSACISTAHACKSVVPGLGIGRPPQRHHPQPHHPHHHPQHHNPQHHRPQHDPHHHHPHHIILIINIMIHYPPTPPHCLGSLAVIMGEFFGENRFQFPKVFPKDFSGPKKPTNLASQDQIHIFFCGFGQRAVVLCELMRQRQDLGGWGLGWSCINGKIIYKTFIKTMET